jgi:leucyl aminopeptidase (aminopeptidase T)
MLENIMVKILYGGCDLMKLYEFELQKAADKLVNEILKVKEGETVLITADTSSNETVVNTTASSIYSVKGKPMVIWTATPDGVGKAADPKLPVEALGAALSKADVWIEYNEKWLLYSTPFEVAFKNNKKLRYINLVGMNPDIMIRNIGKVNIRVLAKFLRKVAEMNRSAAAMTAETPLGTHLEFQLDPTHVVACDAGEAYEPGMFMMPGQINVIPRFGTINGVLVFDGSLVPPCGLLKEPIRMKIENSTIVKIEGGHQADEFKEWLKSLKDPSMYKLAHIAYGFGPGAMLTGNIVEDERVWGAVEWGIGYVSKSEAPPFGQNAVSHCDGICLNSSIWVDNVKIMDNGRIIHPDLVKYVDEIFKK